MRRLVLLATLAFLAAPAAAAAPDWRMSPEYDVLLTSHDIQPEEIRLKAGKPVRLRFVNNSNQRHSFSAKEFFQASQLRKRDGAVVRDGTIELAPLSTATIVVVPKAGRYKAASTSLLRRLLGMSGRIVVE